MKPTLLILAAGAGSRYGGLKQIDSMGPSGEVIMDYSIYDAIKAGFAKIVFVIRHDFEAEFKEKVSSKYIGKIEIDYAFQDINDLPGGFSVPDGRSKPWGTGHAILAAKNVIKEPFAMINADDFYGFDSFNIVAEALNKVAVDSNDWCMSGYKLQNVMSEHGGVTRAVCNIENGLLSKIVEMFDIIKVGDNAVAKDINGMPTNLPLDTLTSMNFFGFTPTLFTLLEKGFIEFLKVKGQEQKSEYLIPTIVNDLIKSNACKMKALATNASWFGVTYPEDKPLVQQSIQKLVAQGSYPTPLFN